MWNLDGLCLAICNNVCVRTDCMYVYLTDICTNYYRNTYLEMIHCIDGMNDWNRGEIPTDLIPTKWELDTYYPSICIRDADPALLYRYLNIKLFVLLFYLLLFEFRLTYIIFCRIHQFYVFNLYLISKVDLQLFTIFSSAILLIQEVGNGTSYSLCFYSENSLWF